MSARPEPVPTRLETAAVSGQSARGRAERTTREILSLLFGPPDSRRFAIRLWDGSVEGPSGESAAFALTLRHAGALRRMFLPPTELNLAESYLRADFDIEGDIEQAILLADDIADRLQAKATIARLTAALLTLPRTTGQRLNIDGRRRERAADKALPAWRRLPQYVFRHSQHRDAETIAFAYDTSNEFYSLWLDERMVYTCAYYKTGLEDLTEAQVNKLDLVCRKLRLKPGERFLDIGCGWGALLHHAIEHYGVTGYGVTLSKEQAKWANDRLARSGLSDRGRVDVLDYRNIDTARRFDKIAAIGVVEHVGVANLANFYAGVFGRLEAGGLLLSHQIVTIMERPTTPGVPASGRVLRQHNPFIQKYIFPDAEMPTVSELVSGAERAGFEVRDVESLREHYAQTFRHWSKRFEARTDEVKRLMGETGYRAYRLYLAAFAPRFERNWMGLTQVLLSRNAAFGRTGLPPGREDIYARGQAGRAS